MQGLVPKAPPPDVANVTWPAGELPGPASVSLTVAVQVVKLLAGTELLVQFTVVEVVRCGVTVTAKLPGPPVVAPAWTVSPA